METYPTILICPLEWGLGHAGRMAAVARLLQDRGCKILIGSGREHQAFFRNHLPGVSFVDFPGFRPRYSSIFPQYIALLAQMPLLLFHIVSEHMKLKSVLREQHVDIVISDNRFGLWNRGIRTVYVTHQINIPFPRPFRFMEPLGALFHRFFIRRYDLCLIPDLPGPANLSGRLSHGMRLPANAFYAGMMSRFPVDDDSPPKPDEEGYNTLILSGPEPQRSLLRKMAAEAFRERTRKLVILEGKPLGNYIASVTVNTFPHNDLSDTSMQRIIRGSEGIICRAGYTTLMELVTMGCSALLVPTPGQTEQEYLADYLSGRGWFTSVKQKDLNKNSILPPAKGNWPEDLSEESCRLLEKAVDIILNK